MSCAAVASASRLQCTAASWRTALPPLSGVSRSRPPPLAATLVVLPPALRDLRRASPPPATATASRAPPPAAGGPPLIAGRVRAVEGDELWG